MRTATFKTDYIRDQRLFDSPQQRASLVIGALLVLGMPAVLSNYLLLVFNLTLIAAIAAIGLNLLTGSTGLVSLGHAAFVAIGAYTTSLLMTHTGAPFLVAMLAGGLVAALVGVVVGLPALRIKGLYLALMTMGFAFVVQFAIRNSDVAGGTIGLPVPRASVFGFLINSEVRFFYLVLPILVLTAMASKNILRRRSGRAFSAVRDRDIAAEIIGISLVRYKLLSFAVSSAFAGLAGGLYAAKVGYISAEHFSLLLSVQYIAMIIVGGLGTVIGAILGALFMTIIPELLIVIGDRLDVTSSGFDDLRFATFGLLIVLVLIFEPEGLAGWWRDVKAYFRAWPFRYVNG